MITEDYVSFETAKLLKEKGFHEKVNHVYHYYNTAPFYHRHLRDFNGEDYKNLRHEHYSAPTLQMVMKWLREVYCLFIDIEPLTGITYAWSIWLMNESKKGESSLVYNTYEQACESAIKYCLEHLI